MGYDVSYHPINENAKAFLIIVDIVGFIAGLFTLSFVASDDSAEAMGYEI